MTHRSVNATVLALVLVLVLGGARPAFALTRQAAFEWTPATGPVAGYAVYASVNGAAEALVAYVTAPAVTLNIESSASLSVRVAAYDSAGRLGPASATSDPLRLCPGDFDGNGTVEITDWFVARSCFGQVAQGYCAGAEINLDNLVGAADINSLKVGADACPTVLCPGDFNGDQVIGPGDLAATQNCLGQPAAGTCASGDANGDGTVSLTDLKYFNLVYGSDACSL